MPRHDLDGYGRNRDRRMRSPSTDGSSTRRRSRSRSRRRSRSHRRSRSPRRSSRSSSKSRHHLKRSHPVCDERSDNDEESDGSDRDRDEYGSRSKRLKRIDVSNPLSAFDVKTKTKLSHIQASVFCKDKWNTIRGMDVKSGKFLSEDRPGPDDWQKMAKSDRIIKKWSGDPAFGDTRLDDGMASVVPKSVSKDETQLLNTQRAMGALGHMVLSATEGFSNLYKKMGDYVDNIIGPPIDPNPDYDAEHDDGSVPKFIFSGRQTSQYDEFILMQREWQVDVFDPLANAARTAAAYHIKILASRRDKIISKVRTANPRAATAISKIPPSASGMFGGDASKLEKVVKLAKDLSGSGKPAFQNSTPSNNNNSFRGRRGNSRGGQHGSSNSGYNREDSKSKFSGNNPRGRGRGGNFRGRGH
jgi:hypothetical protein